MTIFPRIELALPAWLDAVANPERVRLATVEERMDFVVELARQNVEQGTGGPFGAAIFERDTGQLLAPGVNLVVPALCSVAHAEMVAIMVAQQVVGNFDLGADGLPAYELVASTEPCAMCLGALPWSGVRRLVCGASKEDAERHGFDEGDRPAHWIAGLGSRGIDVRCDVCRDAAIDVLARYAELGGIPYNGRQGQPR